MTDWLKLGGEHATLGNYTAARIAFSKAIEGERSPKTLTMAANMHRRLWEFDQARALIDEATTLDPLAGGAWWVSGATWLDMLRPKEAIEALSNSLMLPPAHARWRFTRFWAHMTAGKYREGWDDFESRFDLNQFPPSELPAWDGKARAQLLVRSEQGLGDAVMAERFIPEGALVHAHAPLRRWFDHMGHRTVHAAETIKADASVPMMSLPRLLETPLLEPRKVKRLPSLRLPNKGRFNVGLVWRSKAQGAGSIDEQVHGEQKSCPLDYFLPLAEIPGVKLYSLQRGEAAADVQMAYGLVETMPMADFYDIACWMQALDFVVSIDTGPAHLCGAVGTPGVVLLNCTGGWPWGTGDRSAWYPSLQLARQPKPGDWKGAMDRAAEIIRGLA